MSGCVKRLRDEHQTEDEFQTGFYGLGVGFDLVTGGRRGLCPYELLIGQARARSYLQRNYADPAPRDPACRGGDVPSAGTRHSITIGHQQRGAKQHEPRRL
jgi:hypothetical protein